MSGRFCSLARKSFFVRQTEPVKQTPDGGALHVDPMLFPQRCNQFIKRSPRMLFKPRPNPIMDACKFAVTATTLWFGCQPAGFPFQSHHVVDELDGNTKTPGRFGVRIALFDKLNGPLT